MAVGGKGGSWPVQNELTDERAIPQEADSYCGPACVLILLGCYNQTESKHKQSEIMSLLPYNHADVGGLARILGEIAEIDQSKWRGGFVLGHVQIKNWPAVSSSECVLVISMAERLTKMGAWVARLQEPGQTGHFVVVVGVASVVSILDPSQPGTFYQMTGVDFSRTWDGHAVFLEAET